MAAAQLTSTSFLPSFEGLRPSTSKAPSFVVSMPFRSLTLRSTRGLLVKSASIIAPKYTTLTPLGDRVVKIKAAEEKAVGDILLPSTALKKPQGGEIVAVGEGRTIGDRKTGTPIVYSNYAVRARYKLQEGIRKEFTGPLYAQKIHTSCLGI